jgi:hypothetical protein
MRRGREVKAAGLRAAGIAAAVVTVATRAAVAVPAEEKAADEAATDFRQKITAVPFASRANPAGKTAHEGLPIRRDRAMPREGLTRRKVF